MENLITKFYTSFKNIDADYMVECYHKDIIFIDPAFGTLKGEHTKNIWRMLCDSQKGKGFVVTFSDIFINKNTEKQIGKPYIILVKLGERFIIKLQQNLNLKMALS